MLTVLTTEKTFQIKTKSERQEKGMGVGSEMMGSQGRLS
jgi:hypothetical protein